MPRKLKSNETKKRRNHKEKSHSRDKDYASEKTDRGRQLERGNVEGDDSGGRDGTSVHSDKPVKPNPPAPPPPSPPPPPPPRPRPPRKEDESFETEPGALEYSDDTLDYASVGPVGMGHIHSYPPAIAEQGEAYYQYDTPGSSTQGQSYDRADHHHFSSQSSTLPYSYSQTSSAHSTIQSDYYATNTNSSNPAPSSTEYTHLPAPLTDSTSSNASGLSYGQQYQTQPLYPSQSDYTSQSTYYSQVPHSSYTSHLAQTPYSSSDTPSQSHSYGSSSADPDESQHYAQVRQFEYANLK